MNPPEPPTPPSNSVAEAPPQVALADYLAFLELTPQDAEGLRALKPLFDAFGHDFVDAFYEHLLAFDATSRLLTDSAQISRLKELQRDHFESMLAARWDDAYVSQRKAVGRTHAEVGLNPQLFLGAYNQYIKHIYQRIAAEHGPDAQECVAQLLVLMKVVFLDVGLTLNAYFLQATEKLREALDMYWKANHDLRQFAQLTSHDLKTPIATIANLCEEALDEFGDEMPAEARQLIAAARQRTFETSKMIDELLQSTLAFQSSDSQDEVSSEVVIQEALERLKPELQAKGIKVQLPDAFPYVWGNKVRLREAFFNLLSNAGKFIETSRGRIEIGVAVDESRCVFTVADNGPGIPASEIGSLFAPFRRLKRHRDQPGSGLGLYFTRHLIEQEGGRVWADSEPGAGSRFYVSLHRAPSD